MVPPNPLLFSSRSQLYSQNRWNVAKSIHSCPNEISSFVKKSSKSFCSHWIQLMCTIQSPIVPTIIFIEANLLALTDFFQFLSHCIPLLKISPNPDRYNNNSCTEISISSGSIHLSLSVVRGFTHLNYYWRTVRVPHFQAHSNIWKRKEMMIPTFFTPSTPELSNCS